MSELTRPASVRLEIDRAAAVLGRASIRDPKREAVSMWAVLAGVSVGDVWFSLDGPADERDAASFWEAVESRARGVPLAYAVRSASFRTLELNVEPQVLIPRPETEGLVEHVLQWARDRFGTASKEWGSAADIGTGSGCIALSLAVEGKFARIVAVDVSWDVLDVAAANIARYGIAGIELRAGSMLEPLGEEKFDVIASNPPYLTESEFAALGPEVRDFEPAEALVSGADGMTHVRALLEGASGHLKRTGVLAIEVDSRRALRALNFARSLGWGGALIERDIFGRPRYLIASRDSS